MGRPLRHWWGVGFPKEFEREWSADQSKRCEGELTTSIDEEALDFLDAETG